VFARSTTIQAQPSSIDMLIVHVRDVVMPALREMEGCRGISLLVDRESGRCIATSSWDSKKAMQASAERVWPVRNRATEIFGDAVVDQWEIAVLHRDHHSGPGACVRATWLRARPEQFERGIDFYRWTVMPAVEEFDGFCSASLMVDPITARAVVSVTYDSLEAMERSSDAACSLRTAMLRDFGIDQDDVGEFELAIAHLHVPEMA
jgi:quinol monooxygenase YgiN